MRWSCASKSAAGCVGLRCLSCVACLLQPSQLLQLMLEQLQHLEHLELSLVEDFEVVVDSEISNLRRTASQKRGVAVTHRLRRVYVEVCGDRNFELLRQLVKFCPKRTELHVHLVRETFSNALSECHRLHDGYQGYTHVYTDGSVNKRYFDISIRHSGVT
ncbi:hypothetical protein HPB52_008830 [Rhipicephalus sanguineus]|uniref:Secreted protein n=1 Tax=Rhipicephalus sanguineus TaxID=34632 RepID=A0A9D4QHH6_RHISA|nr:hypothetical protein HPB52_008830 [Rhipicephalus sanguineus]